MSKIDAPEFMSEVGNHYLIVCKDEVTVFPLPTPPANLDDYDAVTLKVKDKLNNYLAKREFDWQVFLKFDGDVFDLTAEIVTLMIAQLEEKSSE